MNLKKSFKSHSLLVRIISVFIVSALLACNLTACDKKDNKGGEETSSNPVVNEKVSDDIYDFDSSYTGGTIGYVAQRDGQFGVLNRDGSIKIEHKFERIYSNYSENLLMAQSDMQNVYIDLKGNIILKTSAAAVDEFIDSVAACAFFNEEDKTYEYGYLSLDTGNKINKDVFYSAKAFSDGYGVCCVKSTGLFGFIKADGTYFIEPKYESAGSFKNGYAPVRVKDKWGFIDKKGDMVIEPKFENVGFFDENGLAKVFVNENWGVIDTTGEFVISPKYEEFNDFKDGYAVVYNGEGYGVIDQKGNYIVKPEYENIYEHNQGLFAVKKDNKWGFANTSGELVIDCQYYFVSSFSEGFAGVQKESDSLCGFIDTTGKTVIEPKFSSIGYFHNGQAVVTTSEGDKLYGVINTKGEYVIEPVYTEITEILK